MGGKWSASFVVTAGDLRSVFLEVLFELMGMIAISNATACVAGCPASELPPPSVG